MAAAFGRAANPGPSKAMTVSAFLILLWQPRALFSPGFQNDVSLRPEDSSSLFPKIPKSRLGGKALAFARALGHDSRDCFGSNTALADLRRDF